MGAVYCCRVFIPILTRARRGKIVLLSGGGATKPLPYLSAYAASKAGLVRFGETLAGELKDRNVDVNMIAPGALNTRLLDEVLEAGPDVVGAGFFAASLKQKEQGGTPLTRGAELCAYLCSEASNGVTGKLISAVWDPWENLQTYAADLLADGRGGIGYLLKERVADTRDFVEAVRRVAEGGTALDPEVVRQLVARRGPLAELTPREREVLGLMAEGRSNAGIAEALVITESAVEKHVGRIFEKLALPGAGSDHRRVLAVLAYLRESG